MNVLLISPSLLRAEIKHYRKSVEKIRGIYPPLGIGYVASSLLSHKHNVCIIDMDTESEPWQKIQKTIREFNPGLIGFHTMTWTFRQANELAKNIKQLAPQAKFVVGGPNISSFPRFSLEVGVFDFAVQGEGELTIIELVDALENEKNLRNIPGLIYREDGTIIQNAPRPLIMHLDDITFPAWQLLPISRYFDVFARNKHFATMITTRGCPWNCTFCDKENRMGRRWRKRSPKNISSEIKRLVSKYDIREFMFFDDNFIVDKEWVYEVCEEIKKLDQKIIWECRTRVDMVDKSLLQAMKNAGCYRIRYGMESGDNEILKILKKDITVEQSVEAARVSKEVGIEIFAYFMMGAPYETPDTLKKTLQLALKVNADFALFSKTILIIGSELFNWAVEKGYIDKDYWKNYLLGKETNPAPALSTEILPEHVVDECISLANRRFYLRPGYLVRKAAGIRSMGQLYRQLRMAKALFTKSK